MLQSKLVLLILFYIICLSNVSSQTYNISGVVLDSENNDPIENVNVYIETLDLGECDLTGITVPDSLSPSLKKLDLHGFDPLLGRYVPPTLITKALASDLEDLDLTACNLDGITVPESLPVGLKELCLFGVSNIPPALINLALGTSTIENFIFQPKAYQVI